MFVCVGHHADIRQHRGHLRADGDAAGQPGGRHGDVAGLAHALHRQLLRGYVGFDSCQVDFFILILSG